MSDHRERSCTKCGSLLHHEDDCPGKPKEMKHVYDWLDLPPADENEKLAKEWLSNFCLPAVERPHAWLSARVLTCEYQGRRWRCIGASRLGDVWITKDFSRENGYDARVDVTDCSNWERKTL